MKHETQGVVRCICVYVHMCVCINVCVRMFLCVFIICVHACVCIYVCVCMCVYVCVLDFLASSIYTMQNTRKAPHCELQQPQAAGKASTEEDR